MGYCFMTIEKVKTKGTMTRKYEHNYRIEPVPNADPNKSHLNDELVPLNGKTYIEAFEHRIKGLDYYKMENGDGEKINHIRKNAVLGIEVVLTFSREEFQNVNIEQWKKDNVEWLRKTFNANPKKYGDNVLSAQFHGDENGNVHIHAFIVPIDDKGKLNASYYLDGRQKMITMQNSYGEAMKKHHLERGLKGSVSKHQTIRHFYASLNQAVGKEAVKPEKNESIDHYYERVKEQFLMLNEKYLALELKYKRKYEEFVTLDLNEKLEYQKIKEEIEQYRNVLEKFGTLKFAQNRLQTILNLNEGLKNYPDRDYAKKAQQMIKTILSYQEDINKTQEHNNLEHNNEHNKSR